MVTVFTPTYNRARLLHRLYESLCKQDCKDFEWLVIDDGSTDETEDLFAEWLELPNNFQITYRKIANGGKQRAINTAFLMAKGEYFFIVDSDDYLKEDAISFIYKAFSTLPQDDSYIGISMIRGDLKARPIERTPAIDSKIGYVDCNNLDRPKYGLQADMAEVFFTRKISCYNFPVWKGETFTPEAVVWDKVAMDGYKIRWFDKVAYYCEYQDDGLTSSTWSLLKKNPMGYAMLFNNQLRVNKYRKAKGDCLTQKMPWVVNTIMQFVSCCCLAGEYSNIKNCESRYVWLLLFPGFLVSLRRRWQFSQYIK